MREIYLISYEVILMFAHKYLFASQMGWDANFVRARFVVVIVAATNAVAVAVTTN